MIAELPLAGRFRDTEYQAKSLSRTFEPAPFVFERFFRRCAAIREDKRVRRVLVLAKSSFQTTTAAALEEIRTELIALREAGKELFYYASDYRDRDLYLASACSQRLMHPLGFLRCAGLAHPHFFFRRLADRYDVSVQVVRRGKYKSAADRFRLDAIDPATLEQYQRYLELSAAHLHETILEAYEKDFGELYELLSGEVLTAATAAARGWVDRVASLHEIRDEWRREKLKTRSVRVPRRVGRGRRIAVLTFEGSIAEGSNDFNPLLGQVIGAQTFVPRIEHLRRNKKVKAVVLRINSGGGSAVGSEEIRGALARLGSEKPLVISMSELAGSGGYWISLTGSTVVASSTSLTGSIGAITIAANVGDALRKQGITHSVVKTHDHADVEASLRALEGDELASLDLQVGSIYDRFVDLVATTRGLERHEAEDRAQGRIWAGADAHAMRLVDRIGGLREAIDAARSQAGLHRARVEFYPRVKHSFVERIIFGAARRTASGTLRAPSIPHDRALAISAIRALASLAGRPMLLDPFVLRSAPSPIGSLHTGAFNAFDADLEVE
ncbi:MAG: signal peptide peptidase SppA [Spirochaetales bacterium]